jgi:hypothetical protein
MRGFVKSFLLAFCAMGAFALDSAMAAESPPAILLPTPFANIFTGDPAVIAQSYPQGTCHISGEQAEKMERRTTDPCLAADASPGNVCFDRLGFGMLRAQRTLLPRGGRQYCAE